MFTYDTETQKLRIRSLEKCLTMNKKLNLSMAKCDDKDEGQKWKLEHLKEDRLKIF